MEYSVCASAVFQGIPLQDAVRKIHTLGYRAFEFWDWEDQNLEAVAEVQRETGIQAVGMCTRMIPLNDPLQRNEFVQGLRDSICAARHLNCSTLIAQAGQTIPGIEREQQRVSIIEGLRECVPILEEEGMVLVLEPLNILVDHKGYFLSESSEVFRIIREVNSPQVKVLFDVYHQQITEGNLLSNMLDNLEYIGHIHIAGNPGRHEPLIDSEVHYPTVLKMLKKAGYNGFIGLEYFPQKEPEQGLYEILQKMPL